MGWYQDESPGHEGFLVGFCEQAPLGAGLWAELSTVAPFIAGVVGITRGRRICVVPRVGVGCDCGWRSPRLVTPPGVYWTGLELEGVPEGLHDQARALWSMHVATMRGVAVDRGGVVAVELLERLGVQ